ncbi:hypothetical protein LTR36_008022 [Oleoguttula mirabilis]|uniref:Uncharacterized protein n=1 Tax=Oleoguttula mirabilis TaxID=1507867 RepID=A0AAV9J902_9PEZI|nr:hypothetical protein LTR36_008022 [Oleoguttula mirabilis]
MAATSPAGRPTPPQEEQPNGAYASYVPHDLKYSADFEDSVVKAVLDPNAQHDGIRVIASDSDEQPVNNVSVRARDVSLQSLPAIAEAELPLPLTDPRRIFASPVAGVKLTHPGGYLEGGPGLDPDMDTFPDDFLSRYEHVTSPDELRKAIRQEIDTSVELLRERLRARQRAKERNEQLEKELKALMDQHGMEYKIHNRLAEENQRKKEARERRRREREGG